MVEARRSCSAAASAIRQPQSTIRTRHSRIRPPSPGHPQRMPRSDYPGASSFTLASGARRLRTNTADRQQSALHITDQTSSTAVTLTAAERQPSSPRQRQAPAASTLTLHSLGCIGLRARVSRGQVSTRASLAATICCRMLGTLPPTGYPVLQLSRRTDARDTGYSCTVEFSCERELRRESFSCVQ